MRKSFLFCSFFLMLLSCGEENENQEQIARIPVDFEVMRFDQRFARATPDSLSRLKEEFPYLFPRQYPDSVWISRMRDTIQLQLDTAVAGTYPDFEKTRHDLKSLFQHIRYYFPKQEVPDKVVTLTSYVDYRNQVVWTDSLLLISLDTYLGMDHPLYLGVQQYLKKNFKTDQIIPDVVTAFAKEQLQEPKERSLLAQMIFYGKILYLKDLLLPGTPDAVKIGYTPEELEWAVANEEQIWRYFVEKELLYSSDTKLYPRFIYPAPFSKFYLALDHEAPDRLGQYIGWQIVRQYMQREDASPQELLTAAPEIIFENANYKPKKS